MGRSKKTGMSLLAWRLNNPELARANDEGTAALEQEITSRLMTCRDCGTQRVVVPANEVPPEVRATLEKTMKISDFVHCPTCGKYSGLGDWGSF